MGSRRMWVLGGILLIVLAGVILGWQVWERYQQNKVAVVVTVVRINRGTVIQEAMLGTREIAATTAAADPTIARQPKAVIGMVAQSDIPEGVMVVQAFLAERVQPGRVLGSGVVIPVGWRAVPIAFDTLDATSRALLIGGALQAGDHVDIYRGELVTTTRPAEEEESPVPVVPALAPTVVPLPDGSPRLEYTLIFSDVVVGDLLGATGQSLLGAARDQAVTVLFLLPEQSAAKKLLEAVPAVRITLLGYERP